MSAQTAPLAPLPSVQYEVAKTFINTAEEKKGGSDRRASSVPPSPNAPAGGDPFDAPPPPPAPTPPSELQSKESRGSSTSNGKKQLQPKDDDLLGRVGKAAMAEMRLLTQIWRLPTTRWLRVVHSGYGNQAWVMALRSSSLTFVMASSHPEGCYVYLPPQEPKENVVEKLMAINIMVRRKTQFHDMKRANKSRLQFKAEVVVHSNGQDKAEAAAFTPGTRDAFEPPTASKHGSGDESGSTTSSDGKKHSGGSGSGGSGSGSGKNPKSHASSTTAGGSQRTTPAHASPVMKGKGKGKGEKAWQDFREQFEQTRHYAETRNSTTRTPSPPEEYETAARLPLPLAPWEGHGANGYKDVFHPPAPGAMPYNEAPHFEGRLTHTPFYHPAHADYDDYWGDMPASLPAGMPPFVPGGPPGGPPGLPPFVPPIAPGAVPPGVPPFVPPVPPGHGGAGLPAGAFVGPTGPGAYPPMFAAPQNDHAELAPIYMCVGMMPVQKGQQHGY